ncbi:MAG: CHAT domain-containing protein, partial [Oscillatoria sp. PMC 1050.18]|nr:CHAT domain-containing protein [Oscillatoria sp. PMC 1050.18]
DQALQIQPEYHEAWNGRGIALNNLGRYEEEIACYDQALQIQPDFHQAWINRSVAAAKSLRHDHYYQQQFLALFQTQLPQSAKLLLATFPNLTDELRQLIQQPLSETAAAQIYRGSQQHPSLFKPELNQRGYPGRLASLQAELDKAIQRETYPEGWGMLHWRIGKAHYFQGRRTAYPRSFWRLAETSYKNALQTLQPPKFEQLHLQVLQDLIKVLIDLDETTEAAVLQERGFSLLRRLLEDPQRPDSQKKNLAQKFASFPQYSVDLAVQTGNLTEALSRAETAKNICLRWLLQQPEPPTLSYAEIQQLTDNQTAVVYWHLSPYALTTFLILPGESAPLLIPPPTNLVTNQLTPAAIPSDGEPSPTDERPPYLLQTLALEAWISHWNQVYPSKDKKESEQGNIEEIWRETIATKLNNLKRILNIAAIAEHLQQRNLPNLILIPHRDLHRFPLPSLFPNSTCRTLPSAYLGLQQTLTANSISPQQSLLLVENPKSTFTQNNETKALPDLPFAEVESALIQRLFHNVTLLSAAQTNQTQVKQTLRQGHDLFHFNGHGAYDETDPAQSCLFLDRRDKLTLLDIIQLNLSQYQLVSLAACETAVTGDETITAEYVGLVSAFLQAGVSYIVSTLWRIESAVSALLMVKFYQLIVDGTPPITALESAQTWLRTSTSEDLVIWLDAAINSLGNNIPLRLTLEDFRENLAMEEGIPYGNPYYWAAFTISGR